MTFISNHSGFALAICDRTLDLYLLTRNQPVQQPPTSNLQPKPQTLQPLPHSLKPQASSLFPKAYSLKPIPFRPAIADN